MWAAQIFAVRLFDGRLAELRDLVDSSADATPSRPIWRAAAAFMHLELQDPEQAEVHFRHLRRIGFSQLPHTVDRPLTLAMLSWVAAEIGSVADARELRRQLRPYRDFLIVLGTAAPSVCAGPAAYPLAMLEARLGRTDAAAAAAHFVETELQATEIGAMRWRDQIRNSRQRLDGDGRIALTPVFTVACLLGSARGCTRVPGLIRTCSCLHGRMLARLGTGCRVPGLTAHLLLSSRSHACSARHGAAPGFPG